MVCNRRGKPIGLARGVGTSSVHFAYVTVDLFDAVWMLMIHSVMERRLSATVSVVSIKRTD